MNTQLPSASSRVLESQKMLREHDAFTEGTSSTLAGEAPQPSPTQQAVQQDQPARDYSAPILPTEGGVPAVVLTDPETGEQFMAPPPSVTEVVRETMERRLPKAAPPAPAPVTKAPAAPVASRPAATKKAPGPKLPPAAFQLDTALRRQANGEALMDAGQERVEERERVQKALDAVLAEERAERIANAQPRSRGYAEKVEDQGGGVRRVSDWESGGKVQPGLRGKSQVQPKAPAPKIDYSEHRGDGGPNPMDTEYPPSTPRMDYSKLEGGGPNPMDALPEEAPRPAKVSPRSSAYSQRMIDEGRRAPAVRRTTPINGSSSAVSSTFTEDELSPDYVPPQFRGMERISATEYRDRNGYTRVDRDYYRRRNAQQR
jgi:hypothetical protein